MSTFGGIIVAIASFVWVSPAPVSVRRWGILPQFRQVRKPEVGAYLDALTKPAFVGVMAEPGHLIALPLSDLDHDAQAAVTLRNQREYFREKYASFPAMLRTGSVKLQLPELDELISVNEMDRLLSEYLLPTPGRSTRKPTQKRRFDSLCAERTWFGRMAAAAFETTIELASVAPLFGAAINTCDQLARRSHTFLQASDVQVILCGEPAELVSPMRVSL